MRRSVFVLALSLQAVGCASWFLNGAKMAEQDYAAGRRDGLIAPKCTMLADNSPIAGGDATYFLVGGSDPGLFERSPDGTGALIQNRWSAADGEHFFVWVQSTGWEFVFPRAGVPQRIVYTGLATREVGAVTQPASAPSAKCDLVPVGGS